MTLKELQDKLQSLIDERDILLEKSKKNNTSIYVTEINTLMRQIHNVQIKINQRKQRGDV